jgi:hypothetical protein
MNARCTYETQSQLLAEAAQRAEERGKNASIAKPIVLSYGVFAEPSHVD